ncbi:ubiquinol cytochrome C oxidoreductase [Fulvivirgaceae bacterium BMA10]|uniref:Ubiquinol cytochrome C oxidoreductase n=1 Tax=Splendidivirga corallicola TaxID=3051826 RepID=A0ABT8KWV4_9BACT|nr:ubiquinol cytochrome C oxidoreductase [Fulvivirgaceae bacterium BMA10]
MKTLTAYRQNNLPFNILNIIVSFSFLVVWLPLLRALFDGLSYRWGTTYFGIAFNGRGLTMDYLFLILQLIFFAVLFLSFYWFRKRKLFYGLLVVWFIHVFGNLLFDIIKNGDHMFHGDTLNVHVSLSAIIIPLSLIAAVLIILSIWKDMNSNEVSISWSKRNRLLAFIVFGPLPIQAIFFATGKPHNITDQIAVIVAIIQCFAIPFILRPDKKEITASLPS